MDVKVGLRVALSAVAAGFNFDEYMAPFWDSNTMYNESVLMVSTNGQPAEASLLFIPIKILSVKNAALNVTYVENVDWKFENGKLKLLPGSSAPYLTNAQLYPTTSESNTQPKIDGGYI